MKKVLTIFGTRPEALKLAPVIKQLEAHPEIDSVTCVTAQHRELLDQVNDLFGIQPDYDLDLMLPNQSLSTLTARVFEHLPKVLDDCKPDWVLVQGDTTTVMSAALTAFYKQIKVGHVEAGLRTEDKWQPFPEEINRRVAGVVADYHFAPTTSARDNLLREGVPESQVFVTGNTIIDALQMIADAPFDLASSSLAQIPFEKKIVLVTAHRRENYGEAIESICNGIKAVAENPAYDVHFVYPVHPNPNVKSVAEAILGDVANVTLLPPLDYRSLIYLMSQSFLVLTDSGGLQEEAPALGVPVFVLREVTERPEGVEAGVAILLGTDQQRIEKMVGKIMVDEDFHQQMANAINPYGDGKAAARIVAAILEDN